MGLGVEGWGMMWVGGLEMRRGWGWGGYLGKKRNVPVSIDVDRGVKVFEREPSSGLVHNPRGEGGAARHAAPLEPALAVPASSFV